MKNDTIAGAAAPAAAPLDEIAAAPQPSCASGCLSCPSAHPDTEGAVIFGVAGGTVEEPRVGYLERPVTPTPDLLALTAPANPAAVFRFGGRCAESACQHFAASHCTLGDRLVQLLPVVSERLPACALRPTCRWWHEQGVAACRRCPQVVTESHAPAAALARAAAPPEPARLEAAATAR
jgi:hypothetical protein